MKNRKKIILVLAIISLFIFIGSTAYTYAKYFTRVNSSQNSNIERWEIIVNDENIKGNKTLEKELVLQLANNEHIAENNIAPGAEGSFYIDLDYTNTDLSFEYKIKLDNNTAITDIILSAEVIEGPSTNFIFENNVISNTIEVNDTITTKTQRIKVNVKWNDDPDTEQMDNTEDTKIPMTNDLITMNLKMNFTQVEN